MNLKKIGLGIGTVIVILSILFTVAFFSFVTINYDNMGKLIKVVSLIKVHSLKDLSTPELIEGAMKGMVNALEDPYSTYLDPKTYEDVEEKIQGTYGGVGLLITMNDNNELVVVTPFKGAPAHRAGIMSGDIITAIDGKNTAEIDLETAANMMQGEPGTKVELTVYREGRGEKKYEITREIIKIPSVDGKIIEDDIRVAYINVSMFNQNTGQELSDTIREFKAEGISGLILDLRNNPGGSLQAAVEAVDVFLDSGPIVYIKSKHDTQVYNAREGKIALPVVVLVNEGTASASEILAGAIQDAKAGILVGDKTFGKGVVQSVFKFNDGSAIKLTTAKYLTPNKRDIHKKGIEPDVKVEMTPEETANALLNAPDMKNDSQLKKALEILREKI